MEPLLALSLLALFVIYVLFGKSSLAITLRNLFRSASDKASDSLADPVRDGEYALQDAQKEANEFRGEIKNLIAANNVLVAQADEARNKENTFAALAKKINSSIQAGDTSEQTARDLDQAINLAKLAGAKVELLTKEIQKNEALESKLRDQLDALQEKIDSGKVNFVALSASSAGLKLRERAAKSAANAEAGSGVAALDNLAKAVQAQEASAEAWEELAASSPAGKEDSLLSRYGQDKGAVTDADRAKYLS